MFESFSEAFRGRAMPGQWEEVHAGARIDYTTDGVVFRTDPWSFAAAGSSGWRERSYLRTTADFYQFPWVAVVTATVTSPTPMPPAGTAFFGLGAAEPTSTFWNEPHGGSHVYCRAAPEDFANGYFGVTRNSKENPVEAIQPGAGVGTHHLWLIWDPGSGGAPEGYATIDGLEIEQRAAPTAVFAISPFRSDGARMLDEATRLNSVDCSGSGFRAGNSRLFLGGAAGVTFRDLELKAIEWSPEP